ncbi:Hypothetical protein CbbY, partial [hydrothermal vent metagenome]
AGDVFSVIAAGDEVAHKKPAPDVYQLALQRLALPPAACLAFEDTAHGLRSALAANLRCVAVPARYSLDQDFSQASLLADSYQQVSLNDLHTAL